MVQAILLKPYASRLPLARLTREERTALAQEIMGTATIPAALERLIGDTTDGNPFLSRSWPCRSWRAASSSAGLRVALLVNQAIVFVRLLQLVEYYADLTRFEPVATGLGDPSLLGNY
jgi:hypothetical protein